MNIDVRPRALLAGFWLAGAFAALLAAGCSGDGGGSGGSTGGSGGGTTSSGGSSGGTTSSSGGGLPTCDETSSSAYHLPFYLYETDNPQPFPAPGSDPGKAIVTGSVTEAATGPLPQDCSYVTAGTANGAWAKIQDADGKSWTACYVAPDASMHVQVGDNVTAEFQWDPGYIDPGSFGLTLRGQDGSLALFVIFLNRGAIDWPSEVVWSDGEQLCSKLGEFTCTYEGYEFDATVLGSKVTITPGQVGTAGGLEIHVGTWEHILDGGGCEAGEADREVFIVPAPVP